MDTKLMFSEASSKGTTAMMTPEPPKVAPTTEATTTTAIPTTTTTEPTTTNAATTTEQPETTTEEATTLMTTTTTTTEVPTTTTTTRKPTTITTTKRPTTTTKPPTTVTATIRTTTTPKPTTTTTKQPTTTKVPTTTIPATTTPDPADTRYSATSQFHLSDLLAAGTPVYPDGPVQSSEDGPDGFGSSADFGDNEEPPERSCLKINDLTKPGKGKASEEQAKCWRNPLHCKQGFSSSIFTKLVFNRKDTTKRYLFSTGGEAEGTPGMAVYYKGIYIYAVVSTGENVWSVHAAGLALNNSWSNVAFTWNQQAGLDLYINAKREAYVKYPDPLPPPPKQPLKPLQLTVGCRRVGRNVYEDFARGKLDEFVAWQYKVPHENASYFLGGMEPDKLCDPPKHPMKCSSDMKTLLEQIDTMDLTNVDTAMTTIMHVAEVAKSTTRKSKKDGTSSGEDVGLLEQQEDLEKKRRDNFRMMVAIVKKLVNKTSGPLTPGVEAEDLSSLYKMQEMVSGLFSESQADLWKEMESEGEDSASLLNSVQDWSMSKLVEAKAENKQVDLLMFSDNVASQSEKGPSKELKRKRAPYLYFPDYGRDPRWAEVKRRWGSPADQVRVPVAALPESDEPISIQSMYYKVFHKMAPVHTSILETNTSGVFLDSRVIKFEVNPSYVHDVLKADPVIIFLEHQSEKSKHDSSAEQIYYPKVETRECVRWSDTLQTPGRTKLGGWTNEGCSRLNSTVSYTTCSCDTLGMFALLALPPVPKKYVEPEDAAWVFAVRGLGYSVSIIALMWYTSAIARRPSLHDQFHIIRLNLAVAAAVLMLAFLSVDFKRHDWVACRVLAGFIHYFYLVVGSWMAILTHALFRGFIKGVVDGRVLYYVLIGWGIPLMWVGVIVASTPRYGYEDRCMVGPSRALRCSLACPLTIISFFCLAWSMVVCCNLTSPQIKRTEVVQELNCSTKMLCFLSIYFVAVWIPGFVALLEIDTGNLRGWRTVFQILNSFMGLFIVFLLGLGSKQFRYVVLEKYVKYLNKLFTNEINPIPFEYTNGYRFDWKNYYYY